MRRSASRLAMLVASAGWVLVVSRAGAQSQAADRGVAEALFEKGRAAMESGDYRTACLAFEESNRLDPAPGTMVNLAGCQEKVGHLSAAWQWLEEAITKLPADDSRREIVVQRAADVKGRLAHWTVRLAPGAPAGAKVLRDSTELRAASLGLALPADPGPHHVVVTAPGRSERRYALFLEERQERELVVEPGPASMSSGAGPVPAATTPTAPPPSAPPDATAVSSTPEPDRRTLGYVIGGVGLAGIGTAFVVGGLVLGKKSTVNDHCDLPDHACDQAGLDAASSGKTLSAVSTVSFILGVAATGVGAYFVLTSQKDPETRVGAVTSERGLLLQLTREL